MLEDKVLNQIQKRIFKSTLKDGLVEIFQGLLIILCVLILIYYYFVIVIIALNLLWKKISNRLKERYIFPRMGYLELADNHQLRMKQFHIIFITMMIFSIIGFFIFVLVNDIGAIESIQYIPVTMGIGFLGKSFYYYIFTGDWKYVIIGIFACLFACLFVFLPFLHSIDHLFYCGMIFSSLFLVVGTMKFLRFIHNNPLTNFEEID